MFRPLALLVFLASCGAGGVCAGCAADDGGDGADLPDSFVVTIVMDHVGCMSGGAQPAPARQRIDGARGLTPGYVSSSLAIAGRGTLACAAAVEDADAWILDCTLTATTSGLYDGASTVRLDKSLTGGSVTMDLATDLCDGAYSIADVEILTP